MTSIIIEKKKYTYEDYLKTPEDKRYMLIEGELIMVPSPIPKHQRISGKIEYVQSRGDLPLFSYFSCCSVCPV